jgi:hypothetical protein
LKGCALAEFRDDAEYLTACRIQIRFLAEIAQQAKGVGDWATYQQAIDLLIGSRLKRTRSCATHFTSASLSTLTSSARSVRMRGTDVADAAVSVERHHHA